MIHDSGAKGVTILTGCNKQLHHVVWQSSGRGPIVSRTPPRMCKRRNGEADERLIWQQLLGDHVTLYSADPGIFPRRPPTGHGRVGSEAGRGWEASRPHLSLQQQAAPSLLCDRVCEGCSHTCVDSRRSSPWSYVTSGPSRDADSQTPWRCRMISCTIKPRSSANGSRNARSPSDRNPSRIARQASSLGRPSCSADAAQLWSGQKARQAAAA